MFDRHVKGESAGGSDVILETAFGILLIEHEITALFVDADSGIDVLPPVHDTELHRTIAELLLSQKSVKLGEFAGIG